MSYKTAKRHGDFVEVERKKFHQAEFKLFTVDRRER